MLWLGAPLLDECETLIVELGVRYVIENVGRRLGGKLADCDCKALSCGWSKIEVVRWRDLIV